MICKFFLAQINIFGGNICFLSSSFPLQIGKYMKLYTPKAPGWRPLADLANKMKATYKGKGGGGRHHIS